MTSVANGSPRLPHCRGPSTASLLSQYSWTPTPPASPAPTGSATGHLRGQQSRWEHPDLSRPEWRFLVWTTRVTSPGTRPSLTRCSHNKGHICTGCQQSHTSTWITLWHHAPRRHTTLVIPLRDSFTPHMDIAAAPMTIRRVLCDTLRWVKGWDTSQGCGPPALRDTWTLLWSLLQLWGYPGRWATCRSQSITSLCALTYCDMVHSPLWALKTADNANGLLRYLREKTVFVFLMLKSTQYYSETLLFSSSKSS